jgi:predicted  nucleic acid-binding Zn-ribbon protein
MFNLFSFMRNYEIKEESKTLMEIIQELSEKVKDLELEVEHLKEESIESANLFYEMMNNIDAVDARIDILTLKRWIDKDV